MTNPLWSYAAAAARLLARLDAADAARGDAFTSGLDMIPEPEPEMIDLPEPEPEGAELGEAAGTRGTDCPHCGGEPKCDDCAGRLP